MSEGRYYEFKLSDGRQVVLKFDFESEFNSYAIFIDGRFKDRRPCGVGWSNAILELRVKGLYDPNPAERYVADTKSLLTHKDHHQFPKKGYKNRNSGDILSARMTILLLKIAQGASKDGIGILSMKREMESIEATVQDMENVTPELRAEFGKLKKAYSDNIYKF
jgi:hypothetical protein